MPRCFVIQPFDSSEFDKRYNETYKPAIEEAGFEAYRVDLDPSVSIPIEHIEEGIRNSDVCFADISIDNPNVWFEVGFAIATDRPICLICKSGRSKYPFDVQHRSIIQYETAVASDFDILHEKIVSRLNAIANTERRLENIIKVAPHVANDQISDMEFTALCFIFENMESDFDCISHNGVQRYMERAGYTKIATQITLHKLVNINFVSRDSFSDQNDNPYFTYKTTLSGTNYILSNMHRLQLSIEKRLDGKNVANEEDIPF